MSNGKRVKTINWVLFAILSCLTLEALLSRQTQFASDDVVAIPQLDVSTNIASPRPPTIGKLLMQYGPINPMYERALATHIPHNQQHNYPMSILRDTTVGNLWSKPAYMLQHILTELEKPYSTRLRWLFWFDSDIVVLNPNVPLEIFLPPPTPDHTYDHIRALVTQDSNGLNTGVFALKVDRWSVNLLTATLATRMALPAVHLRYNDQSAMEFWLQSDLFRNNTMHVPQRWFNAYPGKRGNDPSFSNPDLPQSKWRPYAVKEGDLCVHFAGNGDGRAPRMLPWLDVAEQRQARWEVKLNETGLVEEVRTYWAEEAQKEWDRVEGFRDKCGYDYSGLVRE